MNYDAFLGEVRNRAQLPSREDAVRVTRVTLETLSERLDPGEAGDLAAPTTRRPTLSTTPGR